MVKQSVAGDSRLVVPGAAWSECDAAGRQGMLSDILAQVSKEALEGDTLESVLQRIVDCVVHHLPVAIASIILLNDERTHFVQEVWSGTLDLELPGCLPWPVEVGAAGRCVFTGAAQLIADVDIDADYVPGNHLVKSEYLVPIRHRGRLHGVLNLESIRADFFMPQVCSTFDALAAQIAGAVHLARVLEELASANRKLEQLSMSDGLTGIANRRCLDVRLVQEWQRHAQEDTSMALLLVDVDCFKAFNDAHGHLAGDACLQELARLCATGLNEAPSLVARYGGEEFILLLPRSDLQEATRMAEQLRQQVYALAIAHPASPVAEFVTISIGVSAARPSASGMPQALIEAADRALYEAKAAGRNCVAAAAATV